MAEEFSGVDLFGDPILPRHEGRGRPEHVWTLENSNKVLLAFARGLSVKEAAIAIGISAPTLRKVYFAEVAKRAQAQLRMEMTQLARLNKAADEGNTAAEKELLKQLEKMRQRDQVRAMAPAPTVKPSSPKGKKEQQKEAAAGVGGVFAPPSPPNLLN